MLTGPFGGEVLRNIGERPIGARAQCQLDIVTTRILFPCQGDD